MRGAQVLARARCGRAAGRRALGLLAFACALALAEPAAAHPAEELAGGPPDETEERSRALFDEASRLASQGKWRDACPIFRAAHDIKATGGTTIRLADCYERVGQKADALKLYQSIVAERQSHSPERVAISKARIADLTKEVGSPAREPRNPDGSGATSAPAAPTQPKRIEAAMSGPNRAPGYALIAGGGVAIALGGVFGALALADASAAKQLCPSRPGAACAEAVPAREGATTKAWVSNVAIGVGVVGLAIGVVLVATARAQPVKVGGVRLDPKGASISF